MTLFLGSLGLSALPRLLDKPVVGARLGFVATAGELEVDPHWIERDRNILRAMGFDLTELDLHRDRREIEASVAGLDAIFVAGGNTYFLLQEFRASGFDEVVVEFVDGGGIYAGCSAGAIVLGPDIDMTAESDQRSAATKLQSTEGLNVVPFSVLPHAGVGDERFVAHHTRVLTRPNGTHDVVRITDSEAVVVDDDGWRIVWSPPESVEGLVEDGDVE